MMNFCTLFDSYYMLKGISLYKSLEKVTDDFHLYVMAFDRECYDKLKAIGFERMTVELSDDFESPELLAVKPTRTKAEYCWTCGPSVIWYFLTKYELEDITYLDSDLFFLKAPKVVYDEIAGSSVAITEQGLSEKDAGLYGKYCVQYMYFKNDQEGRKTLKWWRDRCIEWCFQRFEDGKYGDQRYLEEFPRLSPTLRVINNPGVGIAPWNMGRYVYQGNSILKDGIEYPFIFYHMHGISANVKGKELQMRSNDYYFTNEQIKMFLMPYALVNKDVLNTYFKKEITSVKAYGIGKLKKWEYKLRPILRRFQFVRWAYFNLLGITYKGHGQKF